MNESMDAVLGGVGRATLFLTFAACVVQLLLWLTRATSPSIHRAAWFLVLIQGWFLVPLTIQIPVTDTGFGQVTDTGFGQEGHQPPASLSVDEMNNAAASPLQTTSSNLALSLLAVLPNWKTIAIAVWLLGLSTGVGWLAFSYVSFIRKLPSGDAPLESWTREWEDVLSVGGVCKRIPMRVTDDVGPLLCRLPSGYELVVPRDRWGELTRAERIVVLNHELAHYKRGDVWTLLAVRVLALPHWFNPLVWLAVDQLERASEWACDQDATGSDRQQKLTFAKALLTLGQQRNVRPSFHPAACGHSLSQRIRRLTLPTPPEDGAVKRAVLMVLTLGLTVAGVIRFEPVNAAAPGVPSTQSDVSKTNSAAVQPALAAANKVATIAPGGPEKARAVAVLNPADESNATTEKPRRVGCRCSKEH